MPKVEQILDLLRSGRFVEAEAFSAQLVLAEPDNAAAFFVLGHARRSLGDPAHESAFRTAHEMAPEDLDFALGLALALRDRGEFRGAINVYDRALERHDRSAETWALRGIALFGAGDLLAAKRSLERAAELEPKLLAAWSNLGVLSVALRDLDGARFALERATELAPHDIQLLLQLGGVLYRLRDFPAALDTYRRIIEVAPNVVEAHRQSSAVLEELECFSEAVDASRKAASLDPDSPSTRMNLGLLLLRLGRYAEGFEEYEWRKPILGSSLRTHPSETYDGKPLRENQTLLLLAEQGLGDTIQFARFVRQIPKGKGRIALACQAPLVELAQSFAGVDVVTSLGHPFHEGDTHLSLMSLPRVLGVSSIDGGAYLCASPSLARRWAPKVSEGGLRIGLAWQGNPENTIEPQRSIPFRFLCPLFNAQDTTFYLLQKLHGRAALEGLSLPRNVVDIAPELDEGTGRAFVDTAAVLSQLDLLICTDSAIAHLGGALGIRTWLLLSRPGDWRWGYHERRTAWYHSVELFRQTVRGDWATLIRNVQTALALEGERR